MKILFVSSGNFYLGITSVIERQTDSLRKKGIEIVHFYVKGKGIRGYLANVKRLRKMIRAEKPDVVHAHYSLSAYLAVLAGGKPIVVSLMGSDVKSQGFRNFPLKCCHYFFWKRTIVKSDQMKNKLRVNDVEVIPNGVDLQLFQPMDQVNCRKQLGWNANSKYILFAANPVRKEKNFSLAQNACLLLESEDIELVTLSDVLPEEVPIWMNAADIVLLTSINEGSPNVVKEAMACNRPVVTTDVGDIRWLFGDEQGHYISGFEAKDLSEKLNEALEFSSRFGKTSGRNRIIALDLDASQIAGQIVKIYQQVCKRR